jgi:actin-like ATPase involved in cell morphogenesis
MAVTIRGAVVITHPVRWAQPLLDRLREAADLAGIHRRLQVLVSEPEAAAWFYAPPVAGQVVAVFDLGGGTLDTAVLKATDDGFSVAGQPGGDAELGGEDFDEALLAWVAEQAAERDPEAWDELSGAGHRAARDRARLRAEVTAAKEALSKHTSYAVVVDGFDEEFRVTRDDFDKLVEDMVGSAVTEMTRTVAVAAVAPGQLAGLYLTGGSSRVPLIARRLWAALGVEPQLRDDPKAVVALGALRAYQVREAAGPREAARPRKAAGSPEAADLPEAPARVSFSRVRTLPGLSGGFLGTGQLERVVWSPDGSHFAVAFDEKLELWNVATGDNVKTLNLGLWSHQAAVAWSPDSRQVVTGQLASGKLKVWTIDGGSRRLEAPGISGVASLAWNAAGDLIAVGGRSGDICVIDAASGRPRQARITRPRRLACRPRGTCRSPGGPRRASRASCSRSGPSMAWSAA